MVLEWANTVQTELPQQSTSQLMSYDELAYITRRMVLGDPPHIALTRVGVPCGFGAREVAYKIQNVLVSNNLVVRPSRKLPILNTARLNRIIDGLWIPPDCLVGIRTQSRSANRYNIYYMIYLRQIKDLSSIQIQRLAGCPRAKSLLTAYGMWNNKRAKQSRSYANGRKLHANPVRVEWIHPNRLVVDQPLDKSTYRMRVRHYTNVMISKYGNLIRNAKDLNSKGYVVDHIISVADGYSHDGKQTPWSMLCHPANLQVLSSADNNYKGGGSEMSPAKLEVAIRQFSKRHGTVLIPIDTTSLESVRMKYSAMGLTKQGATS